MMTIAKRAIDAAIAGKAPRRRHRGDEELSALEQRRLASRELFIDPCNLASIGFTATLSASLQADLLSCFAIYDPMSGALLPDDAC